MAVGWRIALIAAAVVLTAAAPRGVDKSFGPSQWPTDHDQPSNNAAIPASGDPNIHYRKSFSVLLNSDTPIVDGRLYVVGGDANAQGQSTAPGYVFALSARTGRILWTQVTPNSVYAEPILSAGRVLIGVGNALFPAATGTPSLDPNAVRGVGPSGLYAYDAATGWPLFEFETPGADQAPATVVGSKVYIASGSRQLYVLNLNSGRLLWSVNLGHYVSRSSPRIVNGMVVVGGAGPLGVVAVDMKTGRIAWQRPIHQAIGGVDDTPLAVHGNRLVGAAVLFPKSAGSKRLFRAVVFAIQATTGKILWQQQVAQGPLPRFKETGTPLVWGNTVYVGNALNGDVSALALTTGKVQWTVNAGAPVTRPPVIRRRRVIFVTQQGTLEAVSESGRVLFRRSLGKFVNAYGPVIVGDTAFVTANTPSHGVLIALKLPS